MLVRLSRPARPMIPAVLLTAAFVAAFLLGLTGQAHAADDPNTPWIVTRKADNRVLPKQDSVADIEKGLAEPGKTTNKQPATAKESASPVPQTKAAAIAGQASAPEITVTAKELVLMLPTTVTVTDTRYLNLDNPRRVALDVMGSWKYSGKKKLNVDKAPLAKIEIGKHADFLRLVLHLTKGKVPAEIVPRFQLVEGGLRVTLPLAQ